MQYAPSSMSAYIINLEENTYLPLFLYWLGFFLETRYG